MLNPPNQQSEQKFSSRPCFFFSYARKDIDRYLEQFYEDLSTEIDKRGALDREKGEVSFRDLSSIEPGQDWENEIAQALQHSKVMVCVYSPWYFQREYCGKEFHIFIQRHPNVIFEDGCFRNLKVIVPLFWGNKRDLNRKGLPPHCISSIQVFDPDRNECNDNKKRGLRQILLAEGRRGKYRNLVNDLVDIILDIAKETLPSLCSRPSLNLVKSIFHDLSDWSEPELLQFPVLPMPGKGIRFFFLPYAAVGGDDEFIYESLASCSLSPNPVGTFPLPSGTNDVIGSVIDMVASRCGFVCRELLVNSIAESVIDDITKVLQEAVERNTVIVMVLGEQAMPTDDRMDKLKQTIHEHHEFVLILSFAEFEIPSNRLLSLELDITDYESNIEELFDSLLLEVTTRILENGDVKRDIFDLSGPVENPLISGPGSRREL